MGIIILEMLNFLPNPWPVIVVSKENAEAYAVAVDDEGPWNYRIWLVIMVADGAFWEVPQPEIRMHRNWTMKVAAK